MSKFSDQKLTLLFATALCLLLAGCQPEQKSPPIPAAEGAGRPLNIAPTSPTLAVGASEAATTSPTEDGGDSATTASVTSADSPATSAP